MNDGNSNGLNFSFRKGDNNFSERGEVFIRLANQYNNKDISGTIKFVVVNNDTGETSTMQSQYFSIKARQIDDYEGNFFFVPGNNDSPNVWSGRSASIKSIRVASISLD